MNTETKRKVAPIAADCDNSKNNIISLTQQRGNVNQSYCVIDIKEYPEWGCKFVTVLELEGHEYLGDNRKKWFNVYRIPIGDSAVIKNNTNSNRVVSAKSIELAQRYLANIIAYMYDNKGGRHVTAY